MDRLLNHYGLPNVILINVSLAFVQLFLFSVVPLFLTVFAFFTVSMPVSIYLVFS